jgi:hypothetical protein
VLHRRHLCRAAASRPAALVVPGIAYNNTFDYTSFETGFGQSQFNVLLKLPAHQRRLHDDLHGQIIVGK